MNLETKTQNAVLKNQKLIKQFVSYLFVGGIAFAFNTVVLLLVRNYMVSQNYSIHMADVIGGTAGFTIGLFVNYFLSLLFVFKAKSSMKDFIVVLVVGVIGLVMTSGGLVMLNANMGMPILLAQCVVTAIVFFWNFAARKFLVYRDK